ncbi:Nuclear transport factor 2-like protein [Drosera capensis]
MASNPTPFQVGSYFVSQYYQVLRETPEHAHRFYIDGSVVTRTDGDIEDTTVTTLEDIHSLLTSVHYAGIEISKLKSQQSWNGGLLVFVSGFVKLQGFSGKRRFNEAFFLAPQEKGFFVLNDIFQFVDDEFYDHNPVTEISEINVESEAHPYPHVEQSVSNFPSEEETREYNSIPQEEDNPVDKYSIPDEQLHQEPEEESYVEETLVEESPELTSATVPVQEMPIAPLSEPAGEPARLTYASILRAAKSSVPSSQPPARQAAPPATEQYQWVQASSPQLNPSATSFVPEAVVAVVDNAPVQEEGERASVYVRNLPSNVTNADLERELKNFGRIRPNGVFIKNKKVGWLFTVPAMESMEHQENLCLLACLFYQYGLAFDVQDVGVCFAFVEFEDMTAVQTAVQASPIELLGRLIYIEQRRDSNSSLPRGGGVGRAPSGNRQRFSNCNHFARVNGTGEEGSRHYE